MGPWALAAVRAALITWWLVMAWFCVAGTAMMRRRYWPIRRTGPKTPIYAQPLPKAARRLPRRATAATPFPSALDGMYSRSWLPAAAQAAGGDAKRFPAVAILRPIKGVDAALEENLRCSMELAYPGAVEVVFCVADARDPAADVARRLMAEYPHVQTRLSLAAARNVANPKIANLLGGLALVSAAAEYLWICDSNVAHRPDILNDSVAAFAYHLVRPVAPWRAALRLGAPRRVALVNHVPVATRPQTFGALLEMVFLNATHARMYVALNWLAIDACVVGKSNVLARADLAAAGGLEAYGQFLSEDNTLGQALWDRGLRHHQGWDLVYHPLERISVGEFWARRLRWSRIRKRCVTAAWVVEPLTESIVLGAAVAAVLPPAYRAAFLVVHFALFYLCDLVLFATTFVGDAFTFAPRQPAALSRVRLGRLSLHQLVWFSLAWLLREVLALPLYVAAAAGNRVVWRGAAYSVGRGGSCRAA